jgi:hypothetical protein
MRSSELLVDDPDRRTGRRSRRAPSRLGGSLWFAPSGSRPRRVATYAILLAGAAAVASSALVHLYLWADGYRHVTTIGPLFVVQGIAGLVLAVGLVAYPRVVTAGVSAAYLLASVVALMLSTTIGFLGFMDTLDAPWATSALVIESVGVVLLLAGVALALRRHGIRHMATEPLLTTRKEQQ